MSPRTATEDARRLARALAEVVAPFAAILERITDHMLAPPVAPVLEPTPDVMAVRNLGLEHLGRLIYLPGRPAKGGPALAAEPSVAATGGRLVGIRPGKTSNHADTVATRVLVITQGPALAELSVSVVELVSVAPREW